MRGRRKVVTEAEIESVLVEVNVCLDQPTQPVSGGVWHVGVYFLDKAYGAYRICKVMDDSGSRMGVSQYDTKRWTLSSAVGLRNRTAAKVSA
tara:strand:+ start:1370 stop:1645 length:276 start_codon:yes stop_codon:yes gene_type:complete